MKFFEQFLASLFRFDDEQIGFENAREDKISKSEFLCDVSLKAEWISSSLASEEITLPGRPSLENLNWLLASIAAGKTVSLVADNTELPGKPSVSRQDLSPASVEESIESLQQRFLDLASDVEVVLLTSGSTGTPNRVRLGFVECCYQAIVVGNELALDGKDRQLFYMPLNYVYGLSVALSGLFRHSVLLETAYTLDEPNSFFEQIPRRLVTCFSGVPFTYNLLIKKWGVDKVRASKLRMLTQAGGLLGADVKKQILEELPGIDLWIMYGQTELGGRITQFNLSKNKDKLLSAGAPIEGVEIHVEYEEPGDEDTDGEIYVHSFSCAKNAQEKGDFIEIGNKVFIATGDIGSYRDGYLYISGRNKNFVKVAGSRINLIAVENYFKSLQGITEAVVEYEDSRFPLLLIGVHFSELGGQLQDQASIKSEFLDREGFQEGLTALIRNVPYYIYLYDGDIPRLPSNKINSVFLKESLREQYRKKGSVHIRL